MMQNRDEADPYSFNKLLLSDNLPKRIEGLKRLTLIVESQISELERLNASLIDAAAWQKA